MLQTYFRAFLYSTPETKCDKAIGLLISYVYYTYGHKVDTKDIQRRYRRAGYVRNSHRHQSTRSVRDKYN